MVQPVAVIPRQHSRSALDADTQAVISVDSGSIVEFETSDEVYEQLATSIDLNTALLEQVNRVTGPLGLNGAAPGDVVRVEIIDITIERAWFVFLLGYGPLGTFLGTYEVTPIPIVDGYLHISDRLRLPLQPSIGCIGLAPRRGSRSTFRPVWPWGGNLDLAELSTGSTIWLPVQRPEGFLYIGDVHAAVGAGEPTHVGLEAAARVTVRVTLEHGRSLPAPRLQRGDELLLVGLGHDYRESQHHALQQAMRVLVEGFGLSPREAYAFACASLSYRFGGPAGPVVLACLPLKPLSQWGGQGIPS